MPYVAESVMHDVGDASNPSTVFPTTLDARTRGLTAQVDGCATDRTPCVTFDCEGTSGGLAAARSREKRRSRGGRDRPPRRERAYGW